MNKRMFITERKQRPSGKAWDIYHTGISDTALAEIVMNKHGIGVYDQNGNCVLAYNTPDKDMELTK